jgi:hypothetical protein
MSKKKKIEDESVPGCRCKIAAVSHGGSGLWKTKKKKLRRTETEREASQMKFSAGWSSKFLCEKNWR